MATVDLDDVRTFRGACVSRGMQMVSAATYPRVHVNATITRPPSLSRPVSSPLSVQYLMPEEEIRSLPPSSLLPPPPPLPYTLYLLSPHT